MRAGFMVCCLANMVFVQGGVMRWVLCPRCEWDLLMMHGNISNSDRNSVVGSCVCAPMSTGGRDLAGGTACGLGLATLSGDWSVVVFV
jgi:hypothetical protein